jgi:hypothetical protein
LWFTTRPKTDVATGDVKISAGVVNIDVNTGKSVGIKRIFEPGLRTQKITAEARRRRDHKPDRFHTCQVFSFILIF